MSFGTDLRLFADKVEDRSRRIFFGTVNEVFRSVVDGSEITAAPGQPVDTGFLKGSWLESFPEDWVGEVSTNTVYAEFIEEGDYELRSSVGGPHSVLLTRDNWDRIVEHVTRNETGV